MRAREFIFEGADYDEHARKMSEKYGVPYSMVKHAMRKETGHIDDPSKRAQAVSKRGAGGVMQLMPGTAKEMGVTDRFDPYQNIEGGTKITALGTGAISLTVMVVYLHLNKLAIMSKIMLQMLTNQNWPNLILLH